MLCLEQTKRYLLRPCIFDESWVSMFQVAVVNVVLFLGSVAGWVYILVHNVTRTEAVIADAVHLPLPGCPTIHVSTEWAQWVPGTFSE